MFKKSPVSVLPLNENYTTYCTNLLLSKTSTPGLHFHCWKFTTIFTKSHAISSKSKKL